MQIRKATPEDIEAVSKITALTIKEVYPHYYPEGAVSFFLAHHNPAAIKKDIEDGIVYLCEIDNGKAVGTVTIRSNEICRLFVLPERQGNGFGKALLTFAEKQIAHSYAEIIIDASLPAKPIYLKRGYSFAEYHVIPTENGDHLCYDVMKKVIEQEE